MLLISLCQETLVHVLICDPGIKPFFVNNIPSSATFCKILVFLRFFIYLLNGSIEFFYDYDVYDNQIIIMCQTFNNIDSLHLPQILSRT